MIVQDTECTTDSVFPTATISSSSSASSSSGSGAAEGNKRKTVEEEEESMSRQTAKYLKTLEKAEAKKESGKTHEIVEVAEAEVNEAN